MHGGKAPQVKASAAQRLADMVDPLLTELFRIAESGENDSVRLAAIKDALDRAGYGATTKLDATVQVEDVTGLTDEVRVARIFELADRARTRALGPVRATESDLDATEGAAN